MSGRDGLFHSCVARLQAWWSRHSPLRPWQVEAIATRRLAVLLTLTLVWDVLLGLHGFVIGQIGFTVLYWTTLLAYPVLVVVVALILREPGPRWLHRLPLRSVVRWMPLLLLGIALGLLVELPGALSPTNQMNNDVTPSIVCASRQVLHGRDPYLESELQCLHRFRAPIAMGTPLQAGVLAHQLTYPTATEEAAIARAAARNGWRTSAFATFGYPPMSYVWMLPAASGNLSDWVAYTTVAALVWLLIAGLGAGPTWPALVLVLLVQLGNGGLMSAALHGDGEFFGFGLAALSLVWIDRPRSSGMLMGVGMACHPLVAAVWFGYALFAKTLPGFRERMLWSLGTAVVLVAPWLMLEPHAAEAIVGLVVQPTFADGVGIVSRFQPAPALVLRHVLVGLVVGGFGGLCLVAWFRRELLPVLPVVAMSFMWLGWRSNTNYLSEIFPLAAAMTIGLQRLQAQRRPEPAGADLSVEAGVDPAAGQV